MCVGDSSHHSALHDKLQVTRRYTRSCSQPRWGPESARLRYAPERVPALLGQASKKRDNNRIDQIAVSRPLKLDASAAGSPSIFTPPCMPHSARGPHRKIKKERIWSPGPRDTKVHDSLVIPGVEFRYVPFQVLLSAGPAKRLVERVLRAFVRAVAHGPAVAR